MNIRLLTAVITGVGLTAVGSRARTAEPPPEAPAYVNEVSPLRPMAYKGYKVQNKETIAVLKTKPAATPSKWEFEVGKSRVIPPRRHGAVVWRITKEAKNFVVAKSPPVPKDGKSQVVVVGRFKLPAKGGAGGGAAPPVQPPPPRPHWRSLVKAPGTHVLVYNQYNTVNDTTLPGGAGKRQLSKNDQFIACGQALAKAYPAGDAVIQVKCGLKGDIKAISELPAFLRKKGVKAGDVITFDTLGHGHPGLLLPVTPPVKPVVMLGGRPEAKRFDWVGRAADIKPYKPLPAGLLIDDAKYSALIKPFLRDDAVVGLMHCFTGNDYKDKTKKTVKPLVNRLDTLLAKERFVFGTKGLCWFPSSWIDKNKNGKPDPDEITADQPSPLPSTRPGDVIWSR